ncbi:MAG: UDP-N-acetylmuramoyl-L-alanyl-D-glutamate--2,6-diaminopimelate ligase, partial [Pseudomonadota bacterium]
QLGNFASQFYHYPSQRLKVIGVTGTNGKTSVAWLLTQLLSSMELSENLQNSTYRKNVWAISGTLGWGSLDNLQPTLNTTPGVIEFHRRLNTLCEQGFVGVITEVSSHALIQGRVDGCDFTAAVMTQLGSDHLDYHHTIDEYAAAKSKLFMWKDLPTAIFNLSDAYGQKWLMTSTAKNNWGYANSPNTYFINIKSPIHIMPVIAKNSLSGKFGLRTSVLYEDKIIYLEAPYLFGSFQQENYLAAVTTVFALGYSSEKLSHASKNLVAPPGRMQPVQTESSKVTVLVDYAHTADALRRVLESVRTWCEGKIWIVFGCGGERDRAKRPAMMRAAAELADKIVMTQDNPRGESATKIIKDMLAGLSHLEEIQSFIAKDFLIDEMHHLNNHLSICADRSTAIHYSIQHANENDIVIIAGKGHEKFQEISGKKIPFDDVAVAEQALILKS